ncbi:TIM-barrel domain-containing protein [Pseudoxanthomonas wuyuanensis]|uniref:Alpha-D-xyloside xylohydrolase n=1 Tax=Pseudoxanthomonas wuyuanensis TaxID=1073196 RepID=A0A286DAV1_9GAMM|nr:TIM-barrel domain-containing protein [Pseudoxanthomonas wuyuanensis]KAF1721833.1 alpha-xylosidase [Pseudoxanthomonas wuyuanensis]SOD55763.1 alpha-D-xyloside xylohydrolase [Pseudoxanthomonas wuyuanensis]
MRYLIGLTLPLVALLAGCGGDKAGQAYEKTDNGVIVRPSQEGAAPVRLQVVDAGIIRVSADPDGDFQRSPSLMRVGDGKSDAAFEVDSADGTLRLTTAEVTAEVSLQSGRVSFLDKQGKPMLSEVEGGRSFEPLEVGGNSYLSVRQRFESPDDEAIYGFGQHQQGWMNQKGRDVELLQHNIDMAVPFLVSSRNYGLLWDNNSITRMGDPRGLQPVSNRLKLYDAGGEEGALTARYLVDGVQKVERRETEVNYQYIKDLANFPAEGKGTESQKMQVVWEGEIEAQSAGRHTFSLYASEYAKLWVDGELTIDRWRQNWNPWHHEFALEMQPGQRRKVRIQWDLIDPSYIALLHRDPLPADEARDLSLWSEAGQMVDYYFVAGDSSDQVIAGYRQLTGKSVLLPKWAYGFWQSRERYKSQDELVGALAEYRKRKLPIDNIVLDWSYWPVDAWGSHDFDKTHFPDPDGMVKQVHDMHAQIMISVWPKFYPTTDNYKELDAAGFMYKRNIEVGEKDWIGEGYLSSFYDPYSEKAQAIFWRQMNEKLNSKGFDAWWLDADEPDLHSNIDVGERKARTTPTAIGSSTEFFNSYPLPHTHGVYQGDRAAEPDKRVFILSRKGYAGTQRNATAVWSGDVVSRWDDLRDQISAGVNISMSGLPNWTFDIGGFAVEKRYENQEPAHLAEWRELNLRWFQFGAFAPIFRSHGQFPYREIWNIAPEGTPVYDSLAYYNRLRYTLLPYIYTLAGDTYHRDGSMMRGMAMDFPGDAKVRDINDQYLFGPAFLVAPVTEFKATSRQVYLPAGTSWIDFNSGQRYDGGQTITAAAPLTRMPLFVRAGAIVPTGPVQQYVDEKADAPLTVVVYTGADGQFSLYEDDGKGYGYEKGEFSRIPLAWNEQTGELSIGAREGAFPGMQAQREIRVRWVSGPRADAGALEPATDATVQYDGTALTVRRPAGQ